MTLSKPKTRRRILGGLLIFVGLGAVSGGTSLVLDPTGAELGLDAALLQGTPFPSYLIPGLVLVFVNGVGSIAAGVAAWRGWRYGGHAGAALGAFLLAWIAVQIAVIGFYWVPPFQPVFAVIGVVEVGLGLRVTKDDADARGLRWVPKNSVDEPS